MVSLKYPAHNPEYRAGNTISQENPAPDTRINYHVRVHNNGCAMMCRCRTRIDRCMRIAGSGTNIARTWDECKWNFRFHPRHFEFMMHRATAKRIHRRRGTCGAASARGNMRQERGDRAAQVRRVQDPGAHVRAVSVRRMRGRAQRRIAPAPVFSMRPWKYGIRRDGTGRRRSGVFQPTMLRCRRMTPGRERSREGTFHAACPGSNPDLPCAGRRLPAVAKIARAAPPCSTGLLLRRTAMVKIRYPRLR